MYISGSSRSSEIVARRTGIPPMSPSWTRPVHPEWRALGGWAVQAPMGFGPTGASGWQPKPGAGCRGTSTAPSAACKEAPVAPPPNSPLPEPVAAATTDASEHNKGPADAGHCDVVGTKQHHHDELPAQSGFTSSRSPDFNLARLADHPHARKLVRSVWDKLAELERAGHHAGAIAALRLVLTHHQPTSAGRCRTCHRWTWRRRFPCIVWHQIHGELLGLFAGAGRHRQPATINQAGDRSPAPRRQRGRPLAGRRARG